MNNSQSNAAVWVDHREAIIVVLTPTGEETKRLQLRRSGEPDHGHFESLEVPADDSRERGYLGHLVRYYDEIILNLPKIGHVLILGPGEAKGELQKRLEKHPGDKRTIVLETADKMTEPQLVALVRHHFHCDPARML